MRQELFNVDTALLTKRCVVRRFREGDGPVFYQLVDNNRSNLEENSPGIVSRIKTESDAEAFTRQRIAQWLLQQEYTFGVWTNDEPELIGYVHFYDFDWELPKAEINYFLDRDHTQKGLMTEVLARTVRFAFLQLGLEKIYLHTFTDNFAQQRLARRVGFKKEGTLRNEFRRPGGQLIDLVRMGFARETYGE